MERRKVGWKRDPGKGGRQHNLPPAPTVPLHNVEKDALQRGNSLAQEAECGEQNVGQISAPTVPLARHAVNNLHNHTKQPGKEGNTN